MTSNNRGTAKNKMKEYQKMTVEELLNKKKEIMVEQEKLRKKFDIISYIRLVIFIAFVIFIYLGISEKNTVELIISAALVVCFVVCIVLHSKIDEQREALTAKDEVITRFISRITGKWTAFEDTGAEFIKPENTVVTDLDLMGQGSLYQMISIAHTFDGRKRLAGRLAKRKIDISKVKDRNAAITELSSKKDFLIDLETVLIRMFKRKIRSKEDDILDEALTEADFVDASKERADVAQVSADVPKAASGKQDIEDMAGNHSGQNPAVYLVVSVLILIINIAAIVVAALGLFKFPMAVIGGALILGNIIAAAMGSKAGQLAQVIYSYGVRADDYEKILKALAEENFNSAMLASMTDEIRKNDGILSGFKGLKIIGGMQNISFNPLFHFILNGFMGWSLLTAFFAAKWNERYSDVLIKAKKIIGSFEELSSFAVLSVVRNTVTPELSESAKPFVKAVEAYHPLITPEKVVANSAEINDKVTVITGSNMSGKTTFLRTIAINMVLGFAGANVCAKSFSASYMRIFTSMRVSDDAVNGISTFFAEILRIKEMAEYIKKEQELPAACFIDEIFKGTNSADRIVGAENALTKLSEGNALTMVSTHDFELCDLKDAEGHNVTNHHFEEYYEGDEIRFDYKIKDGRCTTRNAMALLRMAGLS